jgi:serine/threonine protein phosphatase PrpC
MEDACVACDPLPAPPNLEGSGWDDVSFYAVYDGHAGPEASAFAKVSFVHLIASDGLAHYS